jgi:leucyl-tRNA synthetase
MKIKIVGGAFGGMCVMFGGLFLIFQNQNAIREYDADESNGEALVHRSIHAKLMQPLIPHLGESIINETD